MPGGIHLEDSAKVGEDTASPGGAVEVAGFIAKQLSGRNSTVNSAAKGIKRGFLPDRRNLEDVAAVVSEVAARKVESVEVAPPIGDQASVGLDATGILASLEIVEHGFFPVFA